MGDHFDTAYRDAFELARQALLTLDLARICAYSGARILPGSPKTKVELTYLNSPVFLELPHADLSTKDKGPLHVWDKILLLHYLANARPAARDESTISFKQLKSAALYYRLFEGRCIKPLVKAFAGQPDQLIERARALGGHKIQTGDAAANLQVLPHISLSFILWKADEEFPASGTILFNASIEHCLSSEDIVVLSQRTVLKLLGKW